MQFVATARNKVNRDGILAKFNCKAEERRCGYSESVELEKYYDEF